VAVSVVTLVFSDNESRSVRCSDTESVVQAAGRHGLKLLVDCREGACGTCKARCRTGDFLLDEFSREALAPSERDEGVVLTCRMLPQTDCVVELDYPMSQARRGKSTPARSVVVSRLTRIAGDVVELVLEASDGQPFDFLPGQYANLELPASGIWRSYSYATTPGMPEARFAIRLMPDGAMGAWLTDTAKIGDRLNHAGPYGRFFLRKPRGRVLMVAGGTGIAPMLSVLDALSAGVIEPLTVDVVFGITRSENSFYAERLAASLAPIARHRVVRAAVVADAGWSGMVGTAVDALATIEVTAETDAYLCGPPAMIAAARERLHARGLSDRSIFAEAFLPAASAKAA
jgi:benzoate/toluate 1,2-dioxygenase reductase subunit